MAWIRLSDDYNDHPKFDNLSDGAFRLWHQAMGFCRKYKTDGLIPGSSVRQFKAFSVKRQRELVTPWKDGENPLWHAIDGFGVKVHDYLQWNPSKDEENERRADSKERMRLIREARHAKGTPPVTPLVRANNTQTSETRSQNVPGWDGKEERSKELSAPIVRGAVRPIGPNADPEIASRAGLLLEKYAELFTIHCRGARYHARPALDFPKACELVTTWKDDARLEKLAVLVLTTNDDWISDTDRGFGIFAAKASWADLKLAAWEAEKARTA